MKTLILIVLLGLMNSAYGQNQKIAVLKCTIDDYNNSPLYINDSLIKISNNGEFKYSAPLSDSKVLAFRYKNNENNIYLIPNKTLELNFNGSNIYSSFQFKGNPVNINVVLMNIAKISTEIGHYFNTNWYLTYKKDETDFLEVINSKRKLYNDLIDSYLKTDTVGKRYLLNIQADINFSFDKLIMYYPLQHFIFTNENVAFTEKTKKYIDSRDIDNPVYIKMNQYNQFCKQYLYYKIFQEFEKVRSKKTSDNIWLDVSLKVLPSIFKNPEVLDYWQFKEVWDYIDNNGIKNIEPDLAIYRGLSKSDVYKSKIDSLYNINLSNRCNHPIETYKKSNGFKLDAHIFMPKDIQKNELRPAMLYFHGGSWSTGKPDWQFGYSEYGFVNICIEYRTFNRYGVTVPEEISDAKSAIRWVRENADRLHIDKDKIITSGNSSGAHISLCAALLDSLDEPDENLSVSSKPNALILNSCGFDVAKQFSKNEEKIGNFVSPINHVRKGMPPMLIFQGTNDYSTPIQDAEKFINEMTALGNKIYFYPIEGSDHNLWFNSKYWQISSNAKKNFFKEIGFME